MLGWVSQNLLNKCWKSVSWLFCFKFAMVVRLHPNSGQSVWSHGTTWTPWNNLHEMWMLLHKSSKFWNMKSSHTPSNTKGLFSSIMDGWMDKFQFSPLVSKHCCLLFVRTAGHAWSLPPSWPRCLGSDNCSHSVARCIADACRTRSLSPQQISA